MLCLYAFDFNFEEPNTSLHQLTRIPIPQRNVVQRPLFHGAFFNNHTVPIASDVCELKYIDLKGVNFPTLCSVSQDLNDEQLQHGNEVFMHFIEESEKILEYIPYMAIWLGVSDCCQLRLTCVPPQQALCSIRHSTSLPSLLPELKVPSKETYATPVDDRNMYFAMYDSAENITFRHYYDHIIYPSPTVLPPQYHPDTISQKIITSYVVEAIDFQALPPLPIKSKKATSQPPKMNWLSEVAVETTYCSISDDILTTTMSKASHVRHQIVPQYIKYTAPKLTFMDLDILPCTSMMRIPFQNKRREVLLQHKFHRCFQKPYPVGKEAHYQTNIFTGLPAVATPVYRVTDTAAVWNLLPTKVQNVSAPVASNSNLISISDESDEMSQPHADSTVPQNIPEKTLITPEAAPDLARNTQCQYAAEVEDTIETSSESTAAQTGATNDNVNVASTSPSVGGTTCDTANSESGPSNSNDDVPLHSAAVPQHLTNDVPNLPSEGLDDMVNAYMMLHRVPETRLCSSNQFKSRKEAETKETSRTANLSENPDQAFAKPPQNNSSETKAKQTHATQVSPSVPKNYGLHHGNISNSSTQQRYQPHSIIISEQFLVHFTHLVPSLSQRANVVCVDGPIAPPIDIIISPLSSISIITDTILHSKQLLKQYMLSLAQQILRYNSIYVVLLYTEPQSLYDTQISAPFTSLVQYLSSMPLCVPLRTVLSEEGLVARVHAILLDAASNNPDTTIQHNYLDNMSNVYFLAQCTQS